MSEPKTPLGYDQEMQNAAVSAFVDSTGADFWADVQKHLAESEDTGLVTKRPTADNS